MKFAMNGKAYKANYDKVASEPGPLWEKIRGVTGQVYNWPTSTYIAEPPFFEGFEMQPPPRARGDPGRARDGPVRRLDHHRPHLARRRDQGVVAGRASG